MKDNQKNVQEKLSELPTHSMSKSTQDHLHKQIMDALSDVEIQQPERGRLLMKKIQVGVASAAAIVLIGFLGVNIVLNSGNQAGDVEPNVEQTPTTNEDKQKDNQDQEAIEFSKETAKQVMQNYKSAFQEIETNTEGKITNFQTIREIETHLAKAMSMDLVDWLIEAYIQETNGELFMRAMDAPTWLAEDTDFSIEEVNKEHYTIIQERNNELIGHVEMTYHAKMNDGKWILTDIESKELEEQVSIETKAREIYHALHNRNMDLLSNYVHSEKGLTLSLHYYLDEFSAIFEKNQVKTLLEHDTEYLWGYGEANTDLRYTPKGYMDRFLKPDTFLNPNNELFDSQTQRSDLNKQIKAAFPESKIVEFYKESRYEDWKSVYLVFELNDQGIWELVGVVSNEWTP
ncbi:hypothetical protein IMZ08_14095 [Bacillus luteolus]|uniref:Uncharacterized protein n=1 Tax=Litchfieldia luteola TaxID=682179 RepID=A0ABR9QLX5_9BACI|nr:hypothetical protein [Cytobacillus luteolus]MBE4909194.1 hypothetical protein [Cytobacillus luteolus]MBP1940353.1 hypothetical protein [Cytobacillus luteolus]